MMLDIKSKSGLAFNQNVILEHYYATRHGLCQKSDCYLCHPYMTHNRSKYSLGLTKKQIIKARCHLHSKGFVEHRPGGHYYITDKGITAIAVNDYIRSGPKGPHTGKCQKLIKGSLIYYLCTALRTKGTATIAELLSLVPVEPEDYKKTYDNARRLLHWLCKAHIVRQLPRKKKGLAVTSPGYSRYQLMIDLGPKHPVIRVRKHQIYDQNSQTSVAFKEVLKAFKKELHIQ